MLKVSRRWRFMCCDRKCETHLQVHIQFSYPSAPKTHWKLVPESTLQPHLHIDMSPMSLEFNFFIGLSSRCKMKKNLHWKNWDERLPMKPQKEVPPKTFIYNALTESWTSMKYKKIVNTIYRDTKISNIVWCWYYCSNHLRKTSAMIQCDWF